MAIYLVRHGKDEDGFRGSWSQRELIEEGIQQSKKLGIYLRDSKEFTIHQVISSDLKRAVETTRYMNDYLQLPFEKSENCFEMIRDISVDMMAYQTHEKHPTIKKLFASEIGYATPKVDVRAVVFKEDKVLMVQEKEDGKWSLPGGWGDIGLTASEVAIKEVKEESGFEVEAKKLLAVFDKNCHPHPPSPYHVYKIFTQCDIIGGQATVGMETARVAFFDKNHLPPLSVERNTKNQIELAFDYLDHPQKESYFD